MIDLGVVEPAAALGPTRATDGTTILGRLTTTDEQRNEVIEQMTKHLASHSNRGREVRAEVKWSRGEASILVVAFVQEHIEGEPVYLPSKITEMTMAGAEIIPDEGSRLRVLTNELADLHERGMI